jgi:urea transport system permease protein
MLALAVVTCRTAWAADEAIQQAILKLASSDKKERAAALDQLAHSHDGGLVDFMTALNSGSIYAWKSDSGLKIVRNDKAVTAPDGITKLAPLADPITDEPLLADGKQIIVPLKKLDDIGPVGPERRTISAAITSLALWSPDFEQRLTAVLRAGSSENAKLIPELEELAHSSAPEKIRRTATESIDLIHLSTADKPADRAAAAKALADLRSARGGSLLQDRLEQMDKDAKEGKPVDESDRKAYQAAVDKIESYQRLVRGIGYVRDGLSLGSILVLMALGLSITFGVMGVINMAHGELMMIGAFATYTMQLTFVRFLPKSMFNWYFVAALPASFLAAAICGYLIEKLVVRFLYGRPLDTLLATSGVSLILIQAVRLLFGNNIGVNSPTWFVGGFEVIQDLVLPYNRCFIIVLGIFCVGLIYFLMNYTSMGLRVRATMQNREMAGALGVNTRRIDGYTFALGAGVAGIAGYALTLIGGVTPDMGQNYIVDSFLVVVTGGVGELWGAIYAGLGMGMLDKWFEPFTGAVWGRVLLLILVILFIQRRPQGLFPPKGRLADV